jgi:hypothetical protein
MIGVVWRYKMVATKSMSIAPARRMSAIMRRQSDAPLTNYFPSSALRSVEAFTAEYLPRIIKANEIIKQHGRELVVARETRNSLLSGEIMIDADQLTQLRSILGSSFKEGFRQGVRVGIELNPESNFMRSVLAEVWPIVFPGSRSKSAIFG